MAMAMTRACCRARNVMLSSSFTGWQNYMRPLGELVKDSDAMKAFGGTMVLWDFHARKPRQVFEVPGVPLEVRWAWGEDHNYAFTSTALTSKIWLVKEDKDGKWHAQPVAEIGDPSKMPLPVDLSLSADDKTLFVDSFMDGTTRVYDVADPHHPKQIYEKQIGKQLNMVSQSWDGKRVYYTSSLLANWDKTGDANEQFLRAYGWDGKALTRAFCDRLHEGRLGPGPFDELWLPGPLHQLSVGIGGPDRDLRSFREQDHDLRKAGTRSWASQCHGRGFGSA